MTVEIQEAIEITEPRSTFTKEDLFPPWSEDTGFPEVELYENVN